jgi:hypothetical protein
VKARPTTVKTGLRNIDKGFQPFCAGNAHGYCGCRIGGMTGSPLFGVDFLPICANLAILLIDF